METTHKSPNDLESNYINTRKSPFVSSGPFKPTDLGKVKEGLLCQLCPRCAPSLPPRWGVSSEPLLSLSLEGARVASESPVTVRMESDRLGLSQRARGAKLSWTICLALWQI